MYCEDSEVQQQQQNNRALKLKSCYLVCKYEITEFSIEVPALQF